MLKIFAGLLTPFIAITTVCIAYWQVKVARDKLKMEMYDRRYRIYRGVADLFIKILRNDGTNPLPQFIGVTHEARFCFEDKGISDYLKEVLDKALRIKQNRDVIEGVVNEPDLVPTAQRENVGLLTWFNQESANLAGRFQKYLNLGRL